MILNGLGLVSSPLYLFSKFFQGKAIEHLIGPGAKAQYFNDDRLGRVLDQLYSGYLSGEVQRNHSKLLSCMTYAVPHESDNRYIYSR